MSTLMRRRRALIEGGVAYAAESRAIFAAFSVAPSGARKTAIDTFVKALKAAGVWDDLSRLYVAAAHDSQAALIDWKNPGSNTLAKTGTVTFVADRGLTGDGSTGYHNGAGAPNAISGFAQNDAHIGAFVVSHGNGVGVMGRSTSGSPVAMNPGTGGTALLLARVNDANGTDIAVATAVGHSVASRAASGSFTLYKDGVSLSTISAASSALDSADLLFGRAGTNWSTNTVAIWHLGKALNSTKVAALYSAALVYLADLGAAATPRSFTAATSVNLPDGDGGDVGEGFTCTGLALDPNTSTLWVANDGRNIDGDTTYLPSLVNIGLDGTKLGEISLSALYPVMKSIQGLAVDPNDSSFWIASRDESLLRHVDAAGANIASLSIAAPNGLTLDTLRGQLWYSASNATSAVRISKTSTTALQTIDMLRPGAPASGVSPITIDHLHYDAARDWLWASWGDNGLPGWVTAHDITTGKLKYNAKLATAVAVEGIVLIGSTLYVTSDEYYHIVGSLKNRLYTFALSGL